MKLLDRLRKLEQATSSARDALAIWRECVRPDGSSYLSGVTFADTGLRLLRESDETDASFVARAMQAQGERLGDQRHWPREFAAQFQQAQQKEPSHEA